jgi:hypothetical protein
MAEYSACSAEHCRYLTGAKLFEHVAVGSCDLRPGATDCCREPIHEYLIAPVVKKYTRFYALQSG